jgi:hypothetical protein
MTNMSSAARRKPSTSVRKLICTERGFFAGFFFPGKDFPARVAAPSFTATKWRLICSSTVTKLQLAAIASSASLYMT